MKLISIIILMVCTIYGSSLEEKSSVKLIVPVYSQKVSIQLPSIDWKPVFESNKKNTYRIEFVPKEENSRDWKNLISIQGFKSFVKDRSDKEKLSTLVKFSSLLQTNF